LRPNTSPSRPPTSRPTAAASEYALYSRYASKDDLLHTLCTEGLQRVVAETQRALADDRDSWATFEDYMRRCVEADTSSMTLALAGTFTPTPDMFTLAEQANQLAQALFAKVKDVLRPGVDVHDVSLVFEVVAAVKTSDQQRTQQLRRRYLAVILDGLRATERGALPGPPPTWQDVSERWMPAAGQAG
jgi:AcrR family transcriptional regulator